MGTEEDREIEKARATEKLETAIHEYFQAQGWTEGILTDYVFVAAQKGFSDSGRAATFTSMKVRREQGNYATLGLLDWARTRVKLDAFDFCQHEE